jgi:hypothetical protein
MLLRRLLFLFLLFAATPALAEKLEFDHRLYPPLKTVLDSGQPDMVSFNSQNPGYLVDLIVVRGKSTRNWNEALVIIARSPDAMVRSADDWMAELQSQADAKCPNQLTILSRDANSLTIERRSHGCPAGYPATALYRVVQGKSSLFLLAVLVKDDLAAEARTGWLALLASAHLA